MKVILASKSPRRREILSMITKEFDVIVSDEEENINQTLPAKEQAMELAKIKAKSVFDRVKGNRIVIGSDTMVVDLNGKIYGKPKDREDAINMIKVLQGTKHNVITSLAILIEKDGEYAEYIDYDLAEVYFENMTDEEITRWIDTGEAYDKAGAYAVQGEFTKHIEKINGNFWTVMGLPVHKVYKKLKEYI